MSSFFVYIYLRTKTLVYSSRSTRTLSWCGMAWNQIYRVSLIQKPFTLTLASWFWFDNTRNRSLVSCKELRVSSFNEILVLCYNETTTPPENSSEIYYFRKYSISFCKFTTFTFHFLLVAFE